MELSAGIPRREPVGAFRRGEPQALEAGEWGLGRALRHAIGWFDYGVEDEFPDAPSAEADGADANAPVSEAAKMLRHLAVVLQPPLIAPDDPENVLEWPAPLLPFQREGVLTLLARRELLLADAMGLGKTVQAIAALRLLVHRRETRSALIVCPAGLLTQWRRELARWAPELTVLPISGDPFERGRRWHLSAHVKLIGYETLRGDVLDLRDSPARRQNWGVIILDEASRIKNRRSAVAAACKLLPGERRWALTGTPLENSVEDVASLLDFLLRKPDASHPPPASPGELKTLLHTHQLRRRREDVLPQLPPKRVQEIVIELPAPQREAYDRAEQEGIVQLTAGAGSVTIVHVLELISRLKQLCNYDPASGASGKLADIAERMRGLVDEGQRALVFSQFTDDMFGIGRLAVALREFQPLVYTGGQTLHQRAETVQRFLTHPEHKALLLSLRAGGQGLNLQAASYVFHLDRWWNPAIEEQADSRAHRLGQTYPVTVYRYLCAGTIEERIDAKLREKRQIFQDIVEDTTLDLASVLTQAEIFGLLGLTGPRA